MEPAIRAMDGRWRIELLGGLRVTQGERVVTPFRRQKVESLFTYLAFYPRHPHSREELIELLWPETDPEAGRNNLRVTLHLLRRQLSGSGLPVGPLLLASVATVQLCPDAFTTDAAECEAALQAAAHTHDPGERGEHLAAAVALYRGELLPGSFEAWVLTERQTLAEAYQRAVQQLGGLLEQAGDLEAAVVYARKAVSADPLREEAHYDPGALWADASTQRPATRPAPCGSIKSWSGYCGKSWARSLPPLPARWPRNCARVGAPSSLPAHRPAVSRSGRRSPLTSLAPWVAPPLALVSPLSPSPPLRRPPVSPGVPAPRGLRRVSYPGCRRSLRASSGEKRRSPG
jgi:DNA-binding SARP family transcriptional activator